MPDDLIPPHHGAASGPHAPEPTEQAEPRSADPQEPASPSTPAPPSRPDDPRSSPARPPYGRIRPGPPPTPAPPPAAVLPPAPGLPAPAEAPSGERPEDGGPEPATAKEPAPAPSLRAEATSGARWTFASIVGKQGLRLVFLAVLARIIGPTDFGIVGLATIYIAITALMDPQVIGSALVHKPTLDPEDPGALTAITLAIGGVLIVLTLAFAPALASFFHTPALSPMLRVLTITVFLQVLVVPPASMLLRKLDFRAITIAEVGSTAVSTVTGLIAAFAGAGYWSIVVNQLTMDAAFLLLIWASGERTHLRASVAACRNLAGYSLRVTGFQTINYAVRNGDNALIGRFVGDTALGYYSLAYRTMAIPIQNLGAVVGRVTFPVYSRVQNERERIGRQFLLTTRLIAVMAFPLMALVIVGAPLGIPLVFGAKWQPAVLPMQILAVGGMRQASGTTLSSVVLACGRANWMFRWGVFAGVMYLASFVVGVQWGIVGVAVAFVAVDFAISPIIVVFGGRLAGFSFWDYVAAMGPAFGATVALAAAFLAVIALGAGLPTVARLALGAVAGIAAYVAALWIAWPGEIHEARRVIARADAPA